MKQIDVKSWKELQDILLSAVEGVNDIPKKHRQSLLEVRLLSRISAIRLPHKKIKK